ncbi:MAG: FliH/SctL family protein [Pseudomonadota bacterium]
MAAAAKFQFDVDFGSSVPAEKPISKADHAVALGEAESKGFRDGFAQAEKEAVAQAERRTAQAFEQIGATLGRIAGQLAEIEKRLEAEAIEVAVAVGRKLSHELVGREPFAEIAALAADCFRQLATTPHVVVRVNDALLDTARTRLEEIARMRGFEGRLVVIAEPEIALGDCRIEWADGGVTRDIDAIEAAITEAVSRYIGALQSRE